MIQARFDWIMKCLAFEKCTAREKGFIGVCKKDFEKKKDLHPDQEEILESIFRQKVEFEKSKVAWSVPEREFRYR